MPEPLKKRINSRLDEIWLTGDEAAMHDLAGVVIRLTKDWAHARDRVARKEGDLETAAVWARLAKELGVEMRREGR